MSQAQSPDTQPAGQRTCRLEGCPTTFIPPANAKNKEFCCATHRQEFHARQHKTAMALLHASQHGKEELSQ